MQPKAAIFVLLSSLVSLQSTVVFAEPTDASALLEKVRDRDDGKDILAKATLEIRENDGSLRKRELHFLQKDYADEEKMSIFFEAPADVKGVGLQSLNYSEKLNKDDEQWMYLPGLRQIRRIATDDKRGSFMGSQFSYIDLDKLRVTDYSQKIVGQETVGERKCTVIERTPVSDSIVSKSGYQRMLTWVDNERLIVLKQEYFDERNIKFKTLTITRVELVDGIWTAMESNMTDHVNNRSSTLLFSNVRYNVGLDDNNFTQMALKKGVYSEPVSVAH